MPSSESESLMSKTIGMPASRIHWVKSPIVTQLKLRWPIDVNDPEILVDFLTTVRNAGKQPVQITGAPMPDIPKLRVFCEGREVLRLPPKEGSEPLVSMAPPSDNEIKRQTDLVPPGFVGTGGGAIALGTLQLLPGTHIYEVVYWQSELNWIDVREVMEKTDAQGKGKLRYPMTDSAPSNRLYFKIYMPTEEEAREGKTIKFLGEVDAKTQIPQFPLARPGDFAHKTGYWRAEGGGVEALGEHIVFVEEGESMPNLPGDVGFDPFAFQWRFLREK
jgi:hypothetical protein